MSKGGTTSGSTEIPAWLENAAIENINKARDVSQIGYVPYYGPDVAAFSPMQQQSMQSTGNAASAFGLAPQGFNAMAGMPQAETFAGGLQGYSSAPLYEQSLDKLFANAPGQYRALNQQFIDPFTGAAPRNAYNATPMQSSQMMSGGGGGGQAGFVDQAHADRMAQMSSTGRHYGVNSQYNPYAGDASVDINGDGTINMYDMTFGEDGRRPIGDVEKYGNMLLGGIPRIIDGVQGSLFDFMGEGKVSEDPAYLAQQQQLMNRRAADYEASVLAKSQADMNMRAARYEADAQYAEDQLMRQMAEQESIDLLERLTKNAPTTGSTVSTVNSNNGDNPNKGNNNYSGYSKPNKNEGGRPTQSSSPFQVSVYLNYQDKEQHYGRRTYRRF